MKTLVIKLPIQSLRWDFFRGSGKGGQKRNKTDNCARCTHLESGSQGKSEDCRSKEQNKKKALERMISHKDFISWVDNSITILFKEKRNFCTELSEKDIVIYDLGKYIEPKRKEVKRLPVMKDKQKTESRETKKSLKKWID